MSNPFIFNPEEVKKLPDSNVYGMLQEFNDLYEQVKKVEMHVYVDVDELLIRVHEAQIFLLSVINERRGV